MNSRARSSWIEMSGVAPLAAIALLVVNDQWLKAAFPGFVTGKLSDVAICFLLPLLISTFLGLVSKARLGTRLGLGALLGATLFSTLEMSDAAGEAFVSVMSVVGRAPRLTRDPSDLGALVFVPLAVLWALAKERDAARAMRETCSSPRRRVAGVLASAMGSLALMADSQPPLCDQPSPPAVFGVEPGCGPGGLMVVEADEDRGDVTIFNARALGSPPPPLSSTARYTGGRCPFELDRGDWSIAFNSCAPSSASQEAGIDPTTGKAWTVCAQGASLCRAALEGTELWLTCQTQASKELVCRSRLTVMP